MFRPDETFFEGWATSDTRGRLERPVLDFISHDITVGRTGTGKTGRLNGHTLQVLQHYPDRIRVCLLDGKGEASRDLLERFLPAMARSGHQLSPDQVVTFSPWRSGCLVPLNILAPIPGLPPDVHANIVCRLIESMLGERLGQRMAPILSTLVRVGMSGQGSMLDVLRMLEDERFCERVAERLKEPELRRYLLDVLPREPASSRSALRARIAHLLSLDNLRAMLATRDCVSGRDFIEAPISVINLGGGPLGHDELSQWLGAWMFHVITAAVFDRPERTDRPHVALFIDEFQTMVSSHDDMERLLTQARWKDTSVHLYTQSLHQIRNHALVQTVLINISAFCAFAPQLADIQLFQHLLPVTGRQLDPELPDRLLSSARERELLIRRLQRLPPRFAWFVNLARGGESHIIETPGLPYREAARIAAGLSNDEREAFWRGRFGQTLAELTARAAPPLVPLTEPDGTSRPPQAQHAARDSVLGAGSRPRARRRNRRAPPPLELPS